MKLDRELMRGAGPLAVLKLLSAREMYGYQLIQALDSSTGGLLEMGQSTLYPMLYNLEAQGLVASRVEPSEAGRSRKYYRLTKKGKRRLAHDAEQWQAVSGALAALGLAEGRP